MVVPSGPGVLSLKGTGERFTCHFIPAISLVGAISIDISCVFISPTNLETLSAETGCISFSTSKPLEKLALESVTLKNREIAVLTLPADGRTSVWVIMKGYYISYSEKFQRKALKLIF